MCEWHACARLTQSCAGVLEEEACIAFLRAQADVGKLAVCSCGQVWQLIDKSSLLYDSNKVVASCF